MPSFRPRHNAEKKAKPIKIRVIGGDFILLSDQQDKIFAAL